MRAGQYRRGLDTQMYKAALFKLLDRAFYEQAFSPRRKKKKQFLNLLHDIS